MNLFSNNFHINDNPFYWDETNIKHYFETLGDSLDQSGLTALTSCLLMTDDFVLAKLLLDSGFDIEKLNYNDSTVLNYICSYGDQCYKAIEFLIQHNADIHSMDYFSRYPLFKACNNPDSQHIIQLLIDHGADPLQPVFSNMDCFDLLEQGNEKYSNNYHILNNCWQQIELKQQYAPNEEESSQTNNSILL